MEMKHVDNGSTQQKTKDIFFSYTMNLDASFRRVRDRIRCINDYLKTKKITTWFDEEQDRLSEDSELGNSQSSMKERRKAIARGIQSSQMSIIFLTESYLKSATGESFVTASRQSIFTYSYRNETLSVNHRGQTQTIPLFGHQGPIRKQYVHDIVETKVHKERVAKETPSIHDILITRIITNSTTAH